MLRRIILCVFLCVISFTSFLFSQNYASYVNPFIGTGGHGHTFPGATLPFGMVQLSPDTRIDGSWDGCGGYHYNDSIIYGFSHTHLSGTGVSDYGDILIMPTIGKPNFNNKEYASGFSHLNENAAAGFYEVQLNKHNIKAELTSTVRTGIHRYTFPKGETAGIILDLLHRDKTLNCNIRVLDSVTISGFRISEGWAKEQQVYFIMRFSKPFKKIEYALNKKFQEQLDKTKKEKAEGGYFEFDISDGKPLLVKVALSPTNTDGALLNLQTEAAHWDFNKYKKDAELAWNKELSKIEITTSDKNELSVFYTALYHCMIHPSVNMDVDGQYRGRDNKIHTAKGFTYYSVFSLWDTFRTLHPLFTIIDQKRTNDFINTFLYQYVYSKRLPMWELSGNETNCMIGYHAVSVIADAYMKGIGNYDTLLIYEAMKTTANYPDFGIPAYVKNGYLQVDDEPESVSKTLEYAYNDWCIAQLAFKLEQTQDYIYYIKRSQSYKNLFDPSVGFMRPRKNGNWLSPFDPKEVNNHFTEANSWQYSFFVPHDIKGLMHLFGGEKKFEEKLDELFTTSSITTGREQSDITGLIGQYAHGNEPSHHMTYLYNFTGSTEKTISRTHQILNSFYKNTPEGLIGNEDCGQMSAWYVLSSMGIYPFCPGNPEYILSAPIFEKIKINLENGKKFEIFTNNLQKYPASNYIGDIKLNDKAILKSTINHPSLISGGKVVFNLSANPDKNSKYGKNVFQRPKTSVSNYPIITAPIIQSESKSFKEQQQITITAPGTKGPTIVYTTDGSEPVKKSLLYFKPIIIDSSCTIKTKIYSGKDSSSITTAHFFKKPNKWSIIINSKYNKQYTAGGDEGLIDGVYGSVNWRKGDWQGYQAQNFECIINLNEFKTINTLSSNYLQDTQSWILFPNEVQYYVSIDGKKFRPVGNVYNDITAGDYRVQVKKFDLVLSAPQKANYVKIIAKNFGKLPEWHQGYGGEAFIFIDEIEIK